MNGQAWPLTGAIRSDDAPWSTAIETLLNLSYSITNGYSAQQGNYICMPLLTFAESAP